MSDKIPGPGDPEYESTLVELKARKEMREGPATPYAMATAFLIDVLPFVRIKCDGTLCPTDHDYPIRLRDALRDGALIIVPRADIEKHLQDLKTADEWLKVFRTGEAVAVRRADLERLRVKADALGPNEEILDSILEGRLL